MRIRSNPRSNPHFAHFAAFARLFTAALFAAASFTSAAQEVTLKFHHFLPPSSHMHANVVKPWAEGIEKDSGGRIRIQIFPAMQLGGTPPQLIDQLRDGVVDMIWTLPGYTAGRFPVTEVFELPFLTTSTDASSRALWEFVESNGREEYNGIKPLALFMHGPGVIHTARKQINTFADLAGLKIRAPTRLTTRMLQALGATPVSMPVPQTPDAISKGVIDGAVVPWEVVPSVKLDELAKFHAETPRTAPAIYRAVFLFAMNPARYNSLPADLRKVIDAHSGLAVSGRLGALAEAGDAPGRKAAEANKNTITQISLAEVQAAQKKVQPQVIAEWTREIADKGLKGDALVASARALILKHSR